MACQILPNSHLSLRFEQSKTTSPRRVILRPRKSGNNLPQPRFAPVPLLTQLRLPARRSNRVFTGKTRPVKSPCARRFAVMPVPGFRKGKRPVSASQ